MTTPPALSNLATQWSNYEIPPQYLAAHAGEIEKATSIWNTVEPFLKNPAAIKELFLNFVTSHILVPIVSALETTALIALGIIICIALVALTVLIGIGIYKVIRY